MLSVSIQSGWRWFRWWATNIRWTDGSKRTCTRSAGHSSASWIRCHFANDFTKTVSLHKYICSGCVCVCFLFIFACVHFSFRRLSFLTRVNFQANDFILYVHNTRVQYVRCSSEICFCHIKRASLAHFFSLSLYRCTIFSFSLSHLRFPFVVAAVVCILSRLVGDV